jgi:ferredoxin/coenzyme F420-reducing hydrogenase delta subunit
LPIGVFALVWVHVARLARPVLLPARPVLIGSLLALALVAVVFPAPLLPEADLLHSPRIVPLDVFFTGWLPFTEKLPAGIVWLAAIGVTIGFSLIPWLTRPSVQKLPAPAVVNERTCTGCEQCVKDCPYDAIEMIERTDGGTGSVAFVKTDLCTSCGICIGSCPPMAIGPMGVTARDQLADVRALLRDKQPGSNDVVIVGCEWSAARVEAERNGAYFLPVPCVGAMHSSTVEHLLRGGAGGVLVVGCAEHDGRTREGVTWAKERLFEGRKADLKPRVDRDRVRLVEASLGEGVRLHAAVQSFNAEIEALEALSEDELDVVALCKEQAVNS